MDEKRTQSACRRRVGLLLVLLLLFSVAWMGILTGLQPSAVGQAAPPNVIYIMVDALRADHVSSYGYGRNTTPHLDAWVAQPGARFTDATAPSSWTYPSNAAMLTGRMPSTIDVTYSDMESRLPAEETLLAEYLQDAGYATAGFVSAFWVWNRFGFGQGFDYYVNTTGGDRAELVNALALQWLDGPGTAVVAAGQPLFLYLYYFDPHTHYDPPPPYDTQFDSTYTGTLTAEVYGHGHPVVSGEIVPTPRDVEHLIALYDGEIAYWDAQLGQLLAALEARGILDNSLIVVSSDHGQMFGEHGKWVHRNSLYEEVLRVPLLMRYSGAIAPGTVITAPVHGMDVTPTILDFVGLPVPPQMQGQSLKPLLNGAPPPAGRPIYSEMDKVTDPEHPAYWIAPRSELYAVRQNGWKYVHARGRGTEDLLLQVGPTSIYEGPNQITTEPQRAEALFKTLVDYFQLPTEFLYLPVVD